MNDMNTLLIVLGLVAFVSVMVGVVFPLLRRKDIDVDGILKSVKDGLATTTAAMDIARPFLTQVKGIEIVDKITATAAIAVAQAEQLKNIGDIKPGERKAAAEKYVLDALKLLEVGRTPEVERLVTGSIEAAVFAGKEK